MSGVFGGSVGSTREPSSCAVTCAVPVIAPPLPSLASAPVMVVMPALDIVSSAPTKPPSVSSMPNVTSLVTSFIVPSPYIAIAVKLSVAGAPSCSTSMLLGGLMTSVVTVEPPSPPCGPHANGVKTQTSAIALMCA